MLTEYISENGILPTHILHFNDPKDPFNTLYEFGFENNVDHLEDISDYINNNLAYE